MPRRQDLRTVCENRELSMLLQVHVLVLFVTQPKLLNVMVHMVLKNWMESLFILYFNTCI